MYMSPEVWRTVLETDLVSVFYVCRAAIPHMRAGGGGSIVNTASISGLGGDYWLSAYNAAKGALVNYTRTLAIDQVDDNRIQPSGSRPIVRILVDHFGVDFTCGDQDGAKRLISWRTLPAFGGNATHKPVKANCLGGNRWVPFVRDGLPSNQGKRAKCSYNFLQSIPCKGRTKIG